MPSRTATSQRCYNLAVQNPWRDLPLQSPYILGVDRETIHRYSESVRGATRVNLESVPEPFIGDPQTARIVLLNLNPGDADGDREAHCDDAFKKAMLQNLRCESQEYPFYSLNPKFSWTAAGKWWRPRTLELQLAARLDVATFAKRLIVIEWFPYHSRKSGLPTKLVCESQKYSFQLAKEMLDKKLVIRMRSKKHWVGVDQRFGEIPSLKNPQCGYISRGNTEGNLFDRMVEALR
jgi:hypothetical protein